MKPAVTASTLVVLFVLVFAGSGSNQTLGQRPEEGPKRQSSPMLDVNYDDSWVANIPDVIGGHRVRYINTPKSKACTVHPLISLQTQQESIHGFLKDPPDIDSVLQSIPGVPSSYYLSFTPAPFDKEKKAARDREWNESRLRYGCISLGGPVNIDVQNLQEE